LWIYNGSGELNQVLSYAAIAAVCWRRTLARVLMIVVCKGEGVSDRVKGGYLLGALSVIYYCAAALYYVTRLQMHYLGATADLKHMFWIASFVLYTLSHSFFLWAMYSIGKTTFQLQLEGQTYKLSLLRILTIIVYTAFAISVPAQGIENYSSNRLNQNGVWQHIWMYEAGWNLMFCIVLVVVAILWRPSSNNHLLVTQQQVRYDYELVGMRGGQIELSEV
jgi:hypothetical protein